jgi:hypothetical protein
LAQAYSAATRTPSVISCAPTRFTYSVEILTNDIRWLTGNLGDKLEQSHHFGLNGRRLKIHCQFSGESLVETQSSENFQMGSQTVIREIDSTYD